MKNYKVLFFSDSILPRHSRKLKSTNISTLNSYKNRRSRSRWNLVETMLKTQEEHWYRFHYQSSILYISQVFSKKMGKRHFCDAPLNFTVFDLIFNLVFGPHVQKSWKPSSFFFRFWRLVMVAIVLFRITISLISLRKKQKIEKAGFQFVVLCMMNIVSKTHTPIHKIERGMASLPLWQWLDGPSSYELRLSVCTYPVPGTRYLVRNTWNVYSSSIRSKQS